MKRLFLLILVLCVSYTLFAKGASEKTTQGTAYTRETAMQPNSRVRNIIVMIPDGMSSDNITLARWYKAYDAAANTVDPSVTLTLDELSSGLVRTWWTNGKIIGAITDSAPAGTAFATGIKTNDKFIGVTPESKPAATILEAARLIGKSTGIVATSNVQHATPAAFTSHYNDRNRYDIIAEQQAYNCIDVILGGGSLYMAPPYRQDSENMIDEMKAMGYQYISTRDELNAVKGGKVLGLFAPDALAYEMDRGENKPSEPSLSEMTAKAIEILSHNAKGFFLMVEGSKVDWSAHANDPIGVISDVLEFDAAVKVALDFAKEKQNTMVIIMSDHGNGGISIGSALTDNSYSSDPVVKFIAPLKKAQLTGEGIFEKFDKNFANASEVMSQYFGIDDLTKEETDAIKATGTEAWKMSYVAGPIISKRACLGWTTTGHTGEETILFTYLPGNSRIVGTLENTDIPKICAGVWGIDLPALTKGLYIEAGPAFVKKGAIMEIDTSVRSNGTMTVTLGSTTLLIRENKNYVTKNGQNVPVRGVIVNQGGNFYVSQEVLDLIE